MTGTIALDFGAANTVVAYWHKGEQRAKSLFIPDISYPARYWTEGPDPSPGVFLIPSTIQYAADGCKVGQEIDNSLADLEPQSQVLRNFKYDLTTGKKVYCRIGGRQISRIQAAMDYLTRVIGDAASTLGLANQEKGMTITLPVTVLANPALEKKYRQWLESAARQAGIRRVFFVEEPLAAAWGSGCLVKPYRTYLFIDIESRNLNTAVVTAEPRSETGEERFFRIIGLVKDELGGEDIDNWLADEFIKPQGLNPAAVEAVRGQIVDICNKVKERLTVQTETDVNISLPDFELQAVIRREMLLKLLEDNRFFSRIEDNIRQALRRCEHLGHGISSLDGVVMVGGTALIPCIRSWVREYFAGIPVYDQRPLDAVACGAATLAAGVDTCGYIRYDYGLRYLQGDIYEYLPVVAGGTFFPSDGLVAKAIIRASYNGQQEFALLAYRLEEQGGSCINKDEPLILIGSQPFKQGQPAVEVEFGLDGARRLTITARDFLSREILADNVPLAQLI
ncbi:MAG TPA: Hsp70 family protein [Methylomusa anaerophila]|uniref:Chaperone protein DnaK n=1 Tax=Methylomusa anaerophila TaxID=1930071 RepID=A0A348AH16_9FIRM|nr:Hsp70 family protein [Methylomusa anaerophila]BBB90364.1 chaperone protein DnaK [Methylomusa anaerophila]HML89290.1 Hsp70 family protein [Methylomusa anaerophila]